MAHNTSTKIVSVERFIPAAPGLIFELLADPRQHSVFDGSGSVKAARVPSPPRLFLGAEFAMDMRIGLPYKMTNTVVEFEENKRIAWRHFGGHVWRYILEPVDGGTKLTEEFDYKDNKSSLILKIMRAIPNNEKAMIKTLENIEQYFSKQS
ncbi:MAG: SRPBCC family protein [Ilumatobacteraceae bacterium]